MLFIGITVIRMRFDFDPEKSKRLKANPERGIGFEEAKALFESEHITDRRSDDPEQVRPFARSWVSAATQKECDGDG